MPAILTVSIEDIKTYLGVSTTDNDTQITGILAAWDLAIEAMIVPAYLTEASLDEIEDLLTLGKLLIICGHVKNTLPATATAAGAGGKVSVRMGAYQETTETTSSSSSKSGASGQTGDGLIEQGWAILTPYLTEMARQGGIQQVKSTTQDYNSEFRLTRYDSEGHISKSGNLDKW